MDKETSSPGVGYDESIEDIDVSELYRNFSLSQPIIIPKNKLDPQYVYRWINKLDMKNFQRKRGMGWVVVKASELPDLCREGVSVDELHLGTHVDPEGNVALGDDLVMAKMGRSRAQAIKAHLQKIRRERLQSGRKKFHEVGRLAGVATHEEGY